MRSLFKTGLMRFVMVHHSLSPGEDGVKALEISNAIYLSSWLNETVELPVDPELYYEKLQEKINTSTFKKKNVTNMTLDVKGSH